MDINSVKNRFGIIGNSRPLEAAVERAVKVAPIDLSVLVYGESGSGKEFFPQIIHAYGARKHKKYIAVNCGAIPEGTIDSELFGHEKGAFTGAVSSRKGYFEEADGGTIFLDEVAELPMTTQARLLRVLETGEFLKVGSSQVQKTDIRIVAATNVNLLEAVKEGRFREDLYYRLSTVVIDVPPLRERGDDILLLARKFAADFSEKYMTESIRFGEDAQRALLIYPWPGNVRQLKNVTDQLALFNAGEEIDRHTLMELLPLGKGNERDRDEENGGVHLPVNFGGNRQLMRNGDVPGGQIWQYIATLMNEIEGLKGRVAALENGRRGVNPLRSEGALLLGYADGDGSHGAGGSLANHSDVAASPIDEGGSAEDEGMSPLEVAERDAIETALRNAHGDKKAAADRLGISTRTLYRKIQELRIKN